MSDQPLDEEAIEPTDNLTDQLVIATALIAAPDTGDDDEDKFRYNARRLSQLVIELSEWIERGGDLPLQWRPDADEGSEFDDGEATIADPDANPFNM